jgi:hypothetical protein
MDLNQICLDGEFLRHAKNVVAGGFDAVAEKLVNLAD